MNYFDPNIELILLAFLLPLLAVGILFFAVALGATNSLYISILSVFASFIQIVSYGWGFMIGYWNIHIMGREERNVFPGLFFEKPSSSLNTEIEEE